jgi:hypothetical protein
MTFSFPKPKGTNLKDGFEYGQNVYKGRVVSESLSYTSLAGKTDVITSINNWFKTINTAPGYYERDFTTSWGGEKLTADWGSEDIHVMLQYMKKTGDAWVMLHVTRDRSYLKDVVRTSMEGTEIIDEDQSPRMQSP